MEDDSAGWIRVIHACMTDSYQSHCDILSLISIDWLAVTPYRVRYSQIVCIFRVFAATNMLVCVLLLLLLCAERPCPLPVSQADTRVQLRVGPNAQEIKPRARKWAPWVW